LAGAVKDALKLSAATFRKSCDVAAKARKAEAAKAAREQAAAQATASGESMTQNVSKLPQVVFPFRKQRPTYVC
jgi:hypothetical protein